jgi:hypothetical protein
MLEAAGSFEFGARNVRCNTEFHFSLSCSAVPNKYWLTPNSVARRYWLVLETVKRIQARALSPADWSRKEMEEGRSSFSGEYLEI